MNPITLKTMLALTLFFLFSLNASAALIDIEVKYLSQKDAKELIHYANIQKIWVRQVTPSESAAGNELNVVLSVYENETNELNQINSYLTLLQSRNSSPNMLIMRHHECHLLKEIWCKIVGCQCAVPYKQ